MAENRKPGLAGVLFDWDGTLINSYHAEDRKSTRLNSSHLVISYAVFCLKKKKNNNVIHCSAPKLRLACSTTHLRQLFLTNMLPMLRVLHSEYSAYMLGSISDTSHACVAS